MAVPLRKPSAGGRPEDANEHRTPRRRAALPVVQVEGDLAAEVDDLELRLDPHGTPPTWLAYKYGYLSERSRSASGRRNPATGYVSTRVDVVRERE
jgi:hypothetical protein